VSTTVQAQIDAMEAALARGVLEVRDGERTIRYASPEKLLDALSRLRSQSAAAGATGSHGFRLTGIAHGDGK